MLPIGACSGAALLIGYVIVLTALISVAKLFTIACTHMVPVVMFLLSASIICQFILTKIL